MFKNYIFDLDGTLIDTIDDLGTAVNYALKKYNFPERDLLMYPSFVGNGSKVTIQKALGRQIDEGLFKKIYDTYLSYYLENCANLSKPYSQMNEVLNFLYKNGANLYCLTNKPEIAAKKLIERFFPHLFKLVYGDLPNFPKKPDPTRLNLLISKENLNKDETVYIGDSDVDLILAKNANIKNTIFCNYGYGDKNKIESLGPLYRINKPIELIKL